MNLKPPPLPHEHGAWAMLFIAPILGFAAAGRVGASSALVLPALVALFFARYAGVPAAARLAQGKTTPAPLLRRRFAWALVYGTTAAALLALAIHLAPHGARLPICYTAATVLVLGATQAAFALAGRDRTIVAELAGMAGLAAAAPLVLTAAGRPLGGPTIGAGVLAFAYYASSLALVRAYRAPAAARKPAAAASVAAHVGLGLGVLLAWRGGWLPAAALWALVPIGLRTAWNLASPPPTLRHLGFRELGAAMVFLVVAAAALAAG